MPRGRCAPGAPRAAPRAQGGRAGGLRGAGLRRQARGEGAARHSGEVPRLVKAARFTYPPETVMEGREKGLDKTPKFSWSLSISNRV